MNSNASPTQATSLNSFSATESGGAVGGSVGMVVRPRRKETGTQLAAFYIADLGKPSNPKMVPVTFTLAKRNKISS